MTTITRRDAEFTAFVRTRGPALTRLCYLLTGSSAQADDLLQESLLKVYLAMPRIRDAEALDAYARRTITRTHVSLWRRLGRREFTSDIPDRAAVEARSHEDRDEVWRLLATLAPRQRAVLVLRFYDDMTEAEIADVMGTTVGTVKSQLARGLANLRKVAAPTTGPTASVRPAVEGPLR